jgi:hypothetical protein
MVRIHVVHVLVQFMKRKIYKIVKINKPLSRGELSLKEYKLTNSQAKTIEEALRLGTARLKIKSVENEN